MITKNYILVLIIFSLIFSLEIHSQHIKDPIPKLIPYRDKNNKWGFCDKNKNIIIPCKYDKTDFFSEGLAAVKINNLWGFIDSLDQMVIPPQFEKVSKFENGVACIEENLFNKYYIDKKGVIRKTKGNFTIFEVSKKGFLNKYAQVIVPPIYKNFFSLNDSIYIGILENVTPQGSYNKYHLIILNTDSAKVVKLEYNLLYIYWENIPSLRKYKYNLLTAVTNNFEGYVDYYGNEYWEGGNINPNTPKNLNLPDLIPYYNGSKWGYSDKNKNIIIDCVYDNAYLFIDSLAIVKQNDTSIIINKKGDKLFFTKYEISILPNGLITYYDKESKKYGLAKINGNVILTPDYDYIYPFKNSDDYAIAYSKNKNSYVIIDKEGNLFFTDFEYVTPINNNFAKVKKNGKYGITDIKGNIVINIDYEKIDEYKVFDNEMVLVSNNNKYGVVNFITKKEILPCKYNEITFIPDYRLFIVAQTKDYERVGVLDEFGNEIIPIIYKNIYTLAPNGFLLVIDERKREGYADVFGNRYWEDSEKDAINTQISSTTGYNRYYKDITEIDNIIPNIGMQYSYENAKKLNMVLDLCTKIIDNSSHPFRAEAYVRRAYVKVILAGYYNNMTGSLKKLAVTTLNDALDDVNKAISIKPNHTDALALKKIILNTLGY